MTIYENSRFSNIPVQMSFESPSYIQDRTSYLHKDAMMGDKKIVTDNIAGLYNGAKIQILDGLLTEQLIVDHVDGPYQETMWDSTTSTYMLMNHYDVYIKGMLINNHMMNTVIVFPKRNYRPEGIPTVTFREGTISTDSADETIIWRENDRIDILAYTRYGDAQLWWAIIDANPQYTSQLDINVGDTIIVPRFEKVQKYIRSGT